MVTLYHHGLTKTSVQFFQIYLINKYSIWRTFGFSKRMRHYQPTGWGRGDPLNSVQRLEHLDVRNACFFKNGPMGHKAQALVKAFGAALRMQHHLRVAPRSGGVHQ